VITEEEARKKWCPFARVLVDRQSNDENITSANRLENLGVGGCDLDWDAPRCIASECMAWRVAKTENVPTGKDVAVEYKPGRFKTAPEMTTIVHGYCGLAGAP
jgi:hypothetical protein